MLMPENIQDWVPENHLSRFIVKMGKCAFPKKRHTVIKQQNQPSLSPILSAKQQNDN